MPIRHEWYTDAQRILISYIEKPWDWEDYRRGLDEVIGLLDEVEHKVVSVGVYHKAGAPPTGTILNLPRIAELLDHPNFDYYVVVGITSSMGKSAASIFQRVYGSLYFCDTLNEAIMLIEENRAADV
ncbi:MAG: hypothetical protein GYB64_08005 [Chloroflexi bacterium]|nr:hypothetical protein [Chloroflexota bacterium]